MLCSEYTAFSIWSIKTHSLIQKEFIDYLLRSHCTRDTEVNQIDKLPAFMAPTLTGETSRKYIKKELKNIIVAHNKRIMRYKG